MPTLGLEREAGTENHLALLVPLALLLRPTNPAPGRR